MVVGCADNFLTNDLDLRMEVMKEREVDGRDAKNCVWIWTTLQSSF